MSSPPPDHVRAAFGVARGVAEPLPGGQGNSWRCGDVVVKSIDDPAEASWLAQTLEQLRVEGIRVARPLRSSDGRWVISGWTAQRFVSGRAAPRYDEIIRAGHALHAALAELPEPRFLRGRTDLYSWADRLAWGELSDEAGRLGEGHAAGRFAELAAGRRPVRLTSQVVHGDLFGNVLFAGSAPPAVVDITPYWRPTAWAAAVVAVDAVSWGGADTGLLADWAHLAEWPEMLRRALMFRLAVSLAHPRTTPESLVEMLSAADVITPFLA